MVFTPENNWYGGFYELAIELGERSDVRLMTALESVWGHPDLSGPYLQRDREPDDQQISPIRSFMLDGRHLYGVATLPTHTRVACGTVLVREDEGQDWLDLYVPMSALAAAFPVGAYPVGDFETSFEWRRPLDRWFRGIAEHVAGTVSFELALIGFEALGETYAQDLRHTGIPAERFYSFVWPGADMHLEYVEATV